MLILTLPLVTLYILTYAYGLFAWADLIPQSQVTDIPYHVAFTLEHMVLSFAASLPYVTVFEDGSFILHITGCLVSSLCGG